mmetsp:Transcript_100451/g.281472  ORF Transcript_100451/g.281472 Transcript_100451/m.281472 type:complete len:205 (-) Transcript_100451:198-812(-)
MQDHTNAEDVATLVVRRRCDDLRRHEPLGAAFGPHALAAWQEERREPEVDELQRVLRQGHASTLEEEVLQLEVPVRHCAPVEVVHGADDLPERHPGLVFSVTPMGGGLVKEVAAVAQLHRDVEHLSAAEALDHARNVRVVQVDLQVHLPQVLELRGDNLQGALGARLPGLREDDFAERPLAERLADLVHGIYHRALRRGVMSRP